MAVVSNLVKSAKDLCSAEWEFSKFKHRADTFRNSIEADYKTNFSEVEFRGKMAERKLVVDRVSTAHYKKLLAETVVSDPVTIASPDFRGSCKEMEGF